MRALDKNSKTAAYPECPEASEHMPLNRQRLTRIKIRNLLVHDLDIKVPIITAVILFALMIASSFIFKAPDSEAKIKDSSENMITMDFTGDSMLARTIQTMGKSKGYNKFFEHVKPYWDNADLVFTNLENVVLDGNTETYDKQDKNIHLGCDYQGLEALLGAGVNVLGCANNHMYDYGAAQVNKMISYFRKNDVLYSGIGTNAEDAQNYTIIEQNGVRIAFIAITDVYYKIGAAKDDRAGILSTAYSDYNLLINRASQDADLTIVYAHWGDENYMSVETDVQREIGYGMIDAGADIIIGSHPHVLQSIETYKDGIIFYSLGNFIFDQGNTFARDSVMVEYTLDKAGKGAFRLLPLRIVDGVPAETKNPFFKARIKHELTSELSADQYTIDENGYVVIPAVNLK